MRQKDWGRKIPIFLPPFFCHIPTGTDLQIWESACLSSRRSQDRLASSVSFSLPGPASLGCVVKPLDAFMLTERPLPRTPWTRAVAVVAAFSIFAAITVWLALQFDNHWLMGLPFLAAVPVGYYFFWVRRCPECGSRLAARREMLGTTTTYRLLSRCDRCQIDWDTGLLGDTNNDE
jgi:hypothetical protein